jgi:hypothetical protein
MCRNIKNLFNFDPPATEEEIRGAAEQFVRKVSGFQKPSKANEVAFNEAIQQVSENLTKLLNSLSTANQPRNRELEAERARLRNQKRFGSR